MKIAYISYNDMGKYPSPVEDEDSVLLKFLQDKGLDVTREIWNDPAVDWGSYDLGLVKSPWDYFDLIEDFLAWLSRIEKRGLKLLNPVEIIRWNTDKHYLGEIAAAGLKVIPTGFIDKKSYKGLEGYFAHFGAENFIVKPCVSGGSLHTFKVSRENVKETEEKLSGLLKDREFMIQPFIREIESEGEWSFLFFNGKFSHALLKKAKAGDFRVQHSLGGSIHPQHPSEQLLATAQEYADRFAKDCLYARVDGVLIDEVFHLMELELIEPFLFLFTHPNGYENYYEALRERLG